MQTQPAVKQGLNWRLTASNFISLHKRPIGSDIRVAMSIRQFFSTSPSLSSHLLAIGFCNILSKSVTDAEVLTDSNVLSRFQASQRISTAFCNLISPLPKIRCKPTYSFSAVQSIFHGHHWFSHTSNSLVAVYTYHSRRESHSPLQFITKNRRMSRNSNAFTRSMTSGSSEVPDAPPASSKMIGSKGYVFIVGSGIGGIEHLTVEVIRTLP